MNRAPRDEGINKCGPEPKATRKKALLTPATGWMNCENSMLSDRHQTQKATFCMTAFMWNVQNRSLRGDRTRAVTSRCSGAEQSDRLEGSLWGGKSVSDLAGGDELLQPRPFEGLILLPVQRHSQKLLPSQGATGSCPAGHKGFLLLVS